MVSAITKSMIKTTKNIKNKTCAIPDADSEIPVKPINPATIEMIKKNSAHFNIY